MIKKLLTILICLIFLNTPSAYALINIDFLEDEERTSTEDMSLLDIFAEVSKIENHIYELELDIKFLKEPNSTSLRKSLDEKHKELEDLETFMEESGKNLYNEKAEIEAEIEDVLVKIGEEEQLVAVELTEKELELQKAQTLLEKTKEISKERGYDFLRRALVYIVMIFVILLLGTFAKRTIKNHKHLTTTKKEMGARFINTFQIVIISLIIISLFSSRFATLIPILALVGTGLAFAIRDVILSILAWFFIGTKKRFKLNDLIQIGGARGRVLDISLLHTTLKETGENGPTGRIISFPNKNIFEDNLHNFSAMYQFIWVIMDFYLEKGSDIQLAKRRMLEAIDEVAEEDMAEVQKNLPSFSSRLGLNQETAEPKIYFNLEEKGIHAKVKVLARLSNRHELRTKITEQFLEKIKDEPSINLRFLMM